MANLTPGCGSSTIVQQPLAGSLLSSGSPQSVTLTVTDALGNTANCSFNVQLTDVTPPTITCNPQTVVINGQSIQPLTASSLATANDACGTPSLQTSLGSVSCLQLGSVVPVTVTATDARGNSASCVSQITVTGLPCGMSAPPNGVNCADGNAASFDPQTGVYTVSSSNCFAPPFGQTNDQSAFVGRMLCGNGSIQVRVTSLSGLGFAGITMRETLSGGSKKVTLLHNRQSMLRREIRNITNGTGSVTNSPAINRFWLRLVRVGNQIVGYTSVNGTAWNQTMVTSVAMNSCIQVGMVVYGSSPGSEVTATFSNVLIVGSSMQNLQEQGTGSVVDLNSLDLATMLFPNPATDLTYLDLSNLENQEVELLLQDLTGRQVLLQQLPEAPAELYPLDVSSLPNGVYTLSIRIGNQPPRAVRLLVQH